MSAVQYFLRKRPALALLLRTSSTSHSGTHSRDLFLRQAPPVSLVLQTLSELVLMSVQGILTCELLYPFSKLKQLLACGRHEALGVFVRCKAAWDAGRGDFGIRPSDLPDHIRKNSAHAWA